MRRIRYFIFLRDVFLLATTAFGGPQAHLALYIDLLVIKRRYVSESELLEYYALCQMLPGPTSTQTITAVAFKYGGPVLAYLTLLIWMIPAFILLTGTAITILHLDQKDFHIDFTRFITPMAIGYISYSAYKISFKIIQSRRGIFLMIISAAIAFFIQSPYVYPLILIFGGAVTAIKYKRHAIEEKGRFKVVWLNFVVWLGVLIFAVVIANTTDFLPLRLFEKFYRNGSLVFGGGQVLLPLLFGEFVANKQQFLTAEELLTGYSLVQAVPGPVFSFASYVGVFTMKDYNIGWQIFGAFMASAGIFLPGTFLIFFVSRFWEELKKYRIIKASLEGIQAASAGMIAAAAFILFQPLENTFVNFGIMIGTFLVLLFTKIPSPFIIIAGLIAGFIIK